jgi:hypothetical protein
LGTNPKNNYLDTHMSKKNKKWLSDVTILILF